MDLAARIELDLLAHALASTAREVSDRVGEVAEGRLVEVRGAVDAALDALGWVVVELNGGLVRPLGVRADG